MHGSNYRLKEKLKGLAMVLVLELLVIALYLLVTADGCLIVCN
jgi:hypothetical protein